MRLLPLAALGAALLLATSTPAATFLSDPAAPALRGADFVVDLDAEPDNTVFMSRTVGAVSFLSNANPLRLDNQWSALFGMSGIVLETRNGGQPDDFEIRFATPVVAFGFVVNALDIDWTLDLFDASGSLIDRFVIPNQPGQGLSGYARRGYAGAASPSVGIASVRISSPSAHDFALIDEIRGVAEPRTALLLGAGLLGLAIAGNRSRHHLA